MIKYEGTINEYQFDIESLENIITLLENDVFNGPNSCTQEIIQVLLDKIETFLSKISKTEKIAILERYETEEEAREYFSSDFISELNQLFTRLDKEQTIISLHGTDVSNCPSICDRSREMRI